MPDWLAHVLFAYILCSVLATKFTVFANKGNTALVMVGALIPDLIKIGLGFDLLGIAVEDFIAPLHTPVGSFLSAGLMALLFTEALVAFALFVLGFATHFVLDLLLGQHFLSSERTCAKKEPFSRKRKRANHGGW